MNIRVRCPSCVDGVIHDFEPQPGAKPPNLNIAICPLCGARVQTRFFPGWKHESRVVLATDWNLRIVRTFRKSSVGGGEGHFAIREVRPRAGIIENAAGHKDVRLANVRASETARRKAERAAKPQPPRVAPLPRSKELLIRAGGVI